MMEGGEHKHSSKEQEGSHHNNGQPNKQDFQYILLT